MSDFEEELLSEEVEDADIVYDGDDFEEEPITSASRQPAAAAKKAVGPQASAQQTRPPVAQLALSTHQGNSNEEPMHCSSPGPLASTAAFGIEVPTALQLFQQYDRDGSGGIAPAEFAQLLYDLDGLSGVSAAHAARHCAAEFARADLNKDELISVDEFYLYYYGELCFKFPVVRNGLNPGADLFNIFVKYCSVGKSGRCEGMCAFQFAKMARDCGLFNNTTVKRADVDIVYSRARAETGALALRPAAPPPPKRRPRSAAPKPCTPCSHVAPPARMEYPQFLHALLLLGEKRRAGFQAVVERILACVFARPTASCADYLMMRNSGDWKDDEFFERPRGLPPIDAPGGFLARSSAGMLRRLSADADAAASRDGRVGSKLAAAAAAKPWSAANRTRYAAGDASSSIAEGGVGGSTGQQKAVDGSGAANSATCAVPTAPQQQQGAQQQSQQPGQQQQQQQGQKQELGEPEPCDERSFAEQFGRPGGTVMSAQQRRSWGFADMGCVDLGKSGQAALRNSQVLCRARALSQEEMTMALKRSFERYNMWQGGTSISAMDAMRFQKCIRDAQLEKAPLDAARVSSIFARVKSSHKPAINFIEYLEALRHVAAVHRMSLNEVMEKLVVVGGPQGTQTC